MPLDVDLTFDSGAGGFRVHAYEYEDELNQTFALTLEVSHDDPALDPRDFMGRPLVVGLPDEIVVPRIEGIVRRFRQVSVEPTGTSRYHLVLVPRVWLTKKSRDHRIFQDLSAEAICQEVIAGYGGLVPEAVRSRATGGPELEYRVQWGESDLDFMLRVLAEDGVAAFFDHDRESAWSFNTDTTAGLTVLHPPTPFVPPGGDALQSADLHVSRVEVTSNLAPDNKTIRDFDFTRPSFLMEKLRTVRQTRMPAFDVEADLDDYEFDVGSFTAATDRHGETLATQYLQEARARWRELVCETDFMVSAGFRWAIENHPRADVNVPLLVVRAHSRVVEATDTRAIERKHTLTCVPADVPWRPARPPKPCIAGPQTATVVAEVAGTEIDVDEHGRVLLGFRWDRRDIAAGKPTRRVRVSQAWAGGNFGFNTMPRVGTEVVVEYLDGDPDQPIVTGRLHNPESPSPLKLPEEKTKSIWKSQSSPGGDGFNLIMMEDRKGEELLEFRAQRDKVTNVLASHTESVGGNQTSRIGGQVEEFYGANHFTDVETTKTTIVGSNVSENYGANQKTVITDDRTLEVGGNITETCKNQKTTVSARHSHFYGTYVGSGGETSLTAGPMHLFAGPVTVETGPVSWRTPSFRVFGGKIEETQGHWEKVVASWNQRSVFKSQFVATELKFVGSEVKLYGEQMATGALKIDLAGLKVANKGVWLKNSGSNVGKSGMHFSLAGLTTFG